jgi:phenylpropionate dioxygenase-like ring-hydroxylating dioxygenase large terminal subunit
MKSIRWHCAAWSRELAGAPLGRKLLGHNVVLFRDANGTARAVGARCPHRGADLARGSLVDGCLQCPFHGWRFDGFGQCVRIPSQPESVKIPPQASLPSFSLCEREGLLWIWTGAQAPNAPPPRDPIGQPGRSMRRIFFDACLVEAAFLDAVENFFDQAHVPFIHRGTFGPDQDPLVARQRIIVDSDGRVLRAEDDPGSPWRVEPKLPRGLVGLLGRLFLGLRKPIAQRKSFDLERGAEIYLEYPSGTYDLFMTRITPADEKHTWLFVESVRTRAPHALGDWLQRRAIGSVFEEGKLETSLILAADPGAPAHPVSVESDRVGLAARRLCERWFAQSEAPEPDSTAVAPMAG